MSDERADLEATLQRIQGMRAEMRASQKDTDGLEVEIETMRLSGSLSELGYAIYLERLRRTREDISFCLRKLDQERKVALKKLFELDSD